MPNQAEKAHKKDEISGMRRQGWGGGGLCVSHRHSLGSNLNLEAIWLAAQIKVKYGV